MLTSLVYLQQGNVKKSEKMMKIVNNDEKNLHILWTPPSSRIYSFGKTTEGVKLTTPPPPPPSPSLLRVKVNYMVIMFTVRRFKSICRKGKLCTLSVYRFEEAPREQKELQKKNAIFLKYCFCLIFAFP